MPKTFQPPRGTRDFLPEEMLKREHIFSKIREVFESFGFLPMETPAFESWELLSKKSSGGEAIKDEIYYFKDKSDRELGLRFDLTVPMARVLASKPEIPKPFKRYQIGRVWRYDRPQAGRFREFWQADIDIIGSPRMEADTECLAVANKCLKNLGFNNFVIKINNRKILNGILESMKIKEKEKVLRVLDKLDKFGFTKVQQELQSLIGEKTSKLLKFLGKKGTPDILETEQFPENRNVKEGILELKEIVSFSKVYGIKNLEIDFSLVRGLDYYTGPIFEIVIPETGMGSIAGGGRYDNLIELYGGRPTPAVGISLGIERLYEIMVSKNMLPFIKTKTEIFVARVDQRFKEKVLEVAEKLRSFGFRVQTDLMNRDLKKQLEFANKIEIPYVLFVGEREVKTGNFRIKRMKDGKETEGNIKEIIKTLQKELKDL